MYYIEVFPLEIIKAVIPKILHQSGYLVKPFHVTYDGQILFLNDKILHTYPANIIINVSIALKRTVSQGQQNKIFDND